MFHAYFFFQKWLVKKGKNSSYDMYTDYLGTIYNVHVGEIGHIDLKAYKDMYQAQLLLKIISLQSKLIFATIRKSSKICMCLWP